MVFGRGKIFGRRKTGQAAFADQPRTEVPLCAIGDIHGRADLLALALEHIADHAMGQALCVGDYVDRGPDSAGVLRMLARRPDIICLMGNHEEMLLDFLDAPAAAGPRWLYNGGAETLISFGVEARAGVSDADTLTTWRDALAQAMGPGLETWLRGLPSYHLSGNVALTHAGGDPSQPMEAQKAEHLHWGHPKLGRTPRSDGLWVVRGHVIMDDPLAQDRVISIDIGAYARDQLCLAQMGPDRDLHFEIVTA